jgi:TfoX/Sxy family transcriptional regulator of competence genes
VAAEPKQLQAALQAAAPDLELSFRAMFGGIMAYAAGKPFASLSDVGLGLKLTGPGRDELLAVPGAKPLQYAPDQPLSKSYVVVPATMLAQPEILRCWIDRSIASAKAAPTRSRPVAKR